MSRTGLARALLAASLGVAAALLVSCGSTTKGLIPAASAGPLQADFEAVNQAAVNGNGSCSETESAIAKTEQDFNTLPPSVNAGLRSTLREGIANLGTRARSLCAQPLGGVTTQTTATTATQTTPTVTTPTTPTTTTDTTPTTPTTPTTTTPGTGGGTPAPGESEKESEGGAGGVGAGEGK